MNVSELYTDHIVESEVTTDSHTYLAEHGYNYDITATWLVTSGENGYVVQEVSTTAVPFDRADVVADRVRIYTCSCPSYRYQNGIRDLSEREMLEWDACKHIEEVDKSVKAINDEDQAELDQ